MVRSSNAEYTAFAVEDVAVVGVDSNISRGGALGSKADASMPILVPSLSNLRKWDIVASFSAIFSLFLVLHQFLHMLNFAHQWASINLVFAPNSQLVK